MSYSAQLLPTGGLHPVLQLTLNAPPSACPLYLHLDLPPSFIPDRFQLAQLHSEGRLGAPSTSAASLVVEGSRDLEGPSKGAEASGVLLRLREGGDAKGKGKEVLQETFELPLHLRYQPPVPRRWNEQGERVDSVRVELGWPTVFWACEEGEAPPAPPPCPLSALPSSFSLPLSSFTSLHFLSPSNLANTLTSSCPPTLPPPLALPVPTGVIADLPLVESVNVLAIWLGMMWIGWTAFKAWSKDCKGGKMKRE
ncbi:PIG-X protein [Leucosporidium creatinivorum]|uniref:Protein PBN1 n=1 Tax=Leucosporidium creatinivorum TaxID=106004 RepID=A0A1Y2F3G3_9BASI|nr:PIG-X protein [Leucosporidium creatinivorum]